MRRSSVAVGTTVVLSAATLPMLASPAAAADGTYLTVKAGDAGCATDSSCASVQEAVTKALALEAPGQVTIKVPAGTFVEDGPFGSGLEIVAPLVPPTKPLTALTIRGKGATKTLLRPAAAGSPVVTIAETEFPVTFDRVGLTGATGTVAGPIPAAVGVLAITSEPVKLLRSRVSGVRGSDGTNSAPAVSAIGILNLLTDVTLSNSKVLGVTGGNATDPAFSSGGLAVGMLPVISETTLRKSEVTGTRAGNAVNAAAGDSGGLTAAIGVLNISLQPLSLDESSIAGTSTPNAGNGGAGTTFGGFGGTAIAAGLVSILAPVDVTRSTISGTAAGNGGAGGAATDPGGFGGFGGVSAAIASLAVSIGGTDILASTIADNGAGAGGAGGAGATPGDGGLALGAGMLALDVLGRDTTVTHSTLTNTFAGPGGVVGGGVGPTVAFKPGQSAAAPGSSYLTSAASAPVAGKSTVAGALGVADLSIGGDLLDLGNDIAARNQQIDSQTTAKATTASALAAEAQSRLQGVPLTSDAVVGVLKDSVGGASGTEIPSPQSEKDTAAPAAVSEASVTQPAAAPVSRVRLSRSLLFNPDGVNCLQSLSGTGQGFRDIGYNVDQDGACVEPGTGSFTDPALGAGLEKLADYGGPTKTVALEKKAKATRAVPNGKGLCKADDQRGRERPGYGTNEHCAAGAYEPQVGKCQGKKITINGTAGDDKLRGTNKRDVISGGDGDDKISGRGGNDVICGGKESDRIRGGKGDDRISGGKGKDNTSGGPGNDEIDGGPGNDSGDADT